MIGCLVSLFLLLSPSFSLQGLGADFFLCAVVWASVSCPNNLPRTACFALWWRRDWTCSKELEQMIAHLAFVHLSRKWHWVVGLWSLVKKNCRCTSTAQTFRALALSEHVLLCDGLLFKCLYICKPACYREAAWAACGSGCGSQEGWPSEAALSWSCWSGHRVWRPWSWPLSMLMSLFLKAAAGLSPTWKGVSWKVRVQGGHSHLRILLGKEQGVPVHWRAGSRALASVWASSVHPDE